jgi:predicted nuclease of predicted toxin-antitoxin system
MRGYTDAEIWNYAKQQDYIIVSKDDDFRQRSFLSGAPPKVVWINVGNAGTSIILKLLLDSVARIKEFEADLQESLLILNLHVSK